MKKLSFAMGILFSSAAHANTCSNPVTVTCPLMQGTISAGSTVCTSTGTGIMDLTQGAGPPQAITFACSGTDQYSWRVWAQANSLTVNTMTDTNYGMDSTSYITIPGDPLDISCTGGWNSSGHYVLYSFILQNASFSSCTPLDNTQISCCP